MILCLPLIFLGAQTQTMSRPALSDAEVTAYAAKAAGYLDRAYRLDVFPQESPAFHRLNERPRFDEVETRIMNTGRLTFHDKGSTVELNRDGTLWSLQIDPLRLPPLLGEISEATARGLALDACYALGGKGVPTAEHAAPLDPDRYAPNPNAGFAGMKPYCYLFRHYVKGLRLPEGGWRIELDPAGGRVLEAGGSAPCEVEGPLTGFVSPQGAAESAAAAMRGLPDAPARYRASCEGEAAKPSLKILRLPEGYRTALAPHDRELAARHVAVPVYRLDVFQEPSLRFQGRVWPIFWGAVVDARDGRCLAISPRCNPLYDGIASIPAAAVTPEKVAPPFPATVSGFLARSTLVTTDGAIAPASGTPGFGLRRATVRVGKGYRTLLFDPESGLVYAEGRAGRPDARLLKALKAAAAMPTKPFWKR